MYYSRQYLVLLGNTNMKETLYGFHSIISLDFRSVTVQEITSCY